MEQTMRRCIDLVSDIAPGAIGDVLNFRLLECDEEKNDYLMICCTDQWMQNFSGTLHGGLCATILDQAMGVVAYSLKSGQGTVPTVQMEVNYHRPLIPGEEVLVKVHVVSVTRSLMNLTAEAMHAEHPDKICLSGSGIYFCKSLEPETIA